MAPKHFVLIHNATGSGSGPSSKPLLEATSHVVTTFDLEASGDDPRSIESVAFADEYTTPLLNVLKNIPEGDKVILVSHSFGGINAAIAMDKYPEKVVLAVFLNALLPDTTHRPSYVIEEDYKYAMEKIRIGTFFPEPLATREKFTEEGYGSIPRVFISCQQDTGIPTEFQRWEMQNFPVNKVYTLEGDHSPMYSDPEALLAIFLDIAKAKF